MGSELVCGRHAYLFKESLRLQYYLQKGSAKTSTALRKSKKWNSQIRAEYNIIRLQHI